MRFLLLSLALLFPAVGHSAVLINEVAWMGSDSSANHEWIELHNSGDSAVNVTDWTLSDGMNLSVVLAGSIAPGAYVVLERTSDESAPGVAFLIYTGALVNTGAELYLKRADGSLEDQVSGGEDWGSIGGDNSTKETAQYTSTGWITAYGTPGRENAFTGSDNEKTTSNSGSTKLATPAKRADEGVITLSLPDVSLELSITGPTVGYVNQPIDFTAKASGIGNTLINSLEYEWNFGDGYQEAGKETSHRYAYPGTYVVTVYGSYKRQEQVARHQITILPLNVSLTRSKDGNIQINNDSPYEIDISNYVVRAEKKFTMPPRTILLPKQTITISRKHIGFGRAAFLDDIDGLITTEMAGVVSNFPAAQPLVSKSVYKEVSGSSLENSNKNESFSFAVAENEILNERVVLIQDSDETVPIAEKSDDGTEKYTYIGLLGLLLVGTLVILYQGKRN